MNIAGFTRHKPPNREEMESLGQWLLQRLSTHLNVQLLTFKEHYVEEGSVVLTFRAANPLPGFLALHVEGVVLFDVKSTGLPAVDAELFLFSNDRRVGLQSQRGSSYLVINYDVAANAWSRPRWQQDVEEEWERITAPRIEQYGNVVKTYDFE